MVKEITLPKMGLTMEEGIIVAWLKNVGDQVQIGDVLFEVQTDKAVLEVESQDEGYLGSILFKDGDTVPVGSTVGYIVCDMSEVNNIPVSKKEKEVVQEEKMIVNHESKEEKRQNPSRIRCSPAARKVAEEHQINLEQIQGSGPYGRIVLSDVYKYINNLTERAEKTELGKTVSKTKVTGIRKVIAQRLTISSQQIPQFTLSRNVTCENMESVRKKMNELSSGDVKISVNDFLIYAVGYAIKKYPIFNNYYIEEKDEHYIYENEDINIGLAVATENGLIVPVIKKVQDLSLVEIAKKRKEIITKAKTGSLKPDEMQGGTFTISNLGAFGIEQFTAIINPPESGILAVSTTKKVPVVNNQNEIVIQDLMNITASFDHRLVDGADAAQFLDEIVTKLESENWNLF